MQLDEKWGAQKRSNELNILDVDTIQGALEAALTFLSPPIIYEPRLCLSSRTDVGVHSLCSSAHIDLQNENDQPYQPDLVRKTLNRYFMHCNHDIRITSCLPVTNKVHARHSVESRTYLYRFMVAKQFGNRNIPAAEWDRCFEVQAETFDIEKVKKATRLFLGRKDFRTFAKPDKSKRNIKYVRQLNYLTVEDGHPFLPSDPFSANFHYWDIKCCSRAFLYNQVRRIVAALIAVGSGVLTEKDICTMLQVPSPLNWDTRLSLVSAHGLYLYSVNYNPDYLMQNTINYESPCVS